MEMDMPTTRLMTGPILTGCRFGSTTDVANTCQLWHTLLYVTQGTAGKTPISARCQESRNIVFQYTSSDH